MTILFFELNAQSIECHILDLLAPITGRHLGFNITIIYPEKEVVREVMEFNAEKQHLEFKLWDKPVKPEHVILERLIGDKIYGPTTAISHGRK